MNDPSNVNQTFALDTPLAVKAPPIKSSKASRRSSSHLFSRASSGTVEGVGSSHFAGTGAVALQCRLGQNAVAADTNEHIINFY